MEELRQKVKDLENENTNLRHNYNSRRQKTPFCKISPKHLTPNISNSPFPCQHHGSNYPNAATPWLVVFADMDNMLCLPYSKEQEFKETRENGH